MEADAYPRPSEVVMNSIIHEPLSLNSEELAILAELLESERAKLLVEIRHTDHRTFRDELRQRLTVVEGLAERCATRSGHGGQS
jgi:hypothetical protein